MDRQIPKFYTLIWTVLAVLFTGALMTSGTVSWYFSLLCLCWFSVFEIAGISSAKAGDTLSETVWKILDIRNNTPTNRALFPLVMGLFSAASCLFIGIVEGAHDTNMSTIARIIAASFVSAGTLAFLLRHFRRGDSQ